VLCRSVAGLWIRVPWPCFNGKDGPTDHRTDCSFQPSGATTDDVGSTVENGQAPGGSRATHSTQAAIDCDGSMVWVRSSS
jgi:hypothetical protein